MKSTSRSPEAKAWQWLYNTSRWRKLSKLHLATERLCRRCKEQGRWTQAEVCDHIIPHHGNVEMFFAGPFQSLCWPCHSGPKQSEERLGYLKGSINGRPRDPNHPWNTRRG